MVSPLSPGRSRMEARNPWKKQAVSIPLCSRLGVLSESRQTGLLVAARRMDLEVARTDSHRGYIRRVGRVGADQHQALAGGAVKHVQVQPVSAAARLTVVLGAAPEADGGIRHRVAVDTLQGAGALEVNYVHVDRRCCVRPTAAPDHRNLLALEMQAIEVVNDVPVAATGRRWAATRIDHAAEAEVRLALGIDRCFGGPGCHCCHLALANGSATG